MNEQTIERPEVVEEEMLDYLDMVRDSGVTNMFGAVPYLVSEFGISNQDAITVLAYWMRTFGQRKTVYE